jgi:beta-galactosidase
MRERLSLCRDWEFTERFSEAFSRGLACETVTVNLPHTCRETPYHYFDDQIYQMVCGYRKSVTIPDDWTDKDVFLCIGAAGHYAEVYCNGEKLASHACGYTAFEVALPLKAGETGEIAVMVDSRESLDQPPFGFVIDYMTYGGLYREVWLEGREKTCILDVFVQPKIPARTPLLKKTASAAELAKIRFPGQMESFITFRAANNHKHMFLRQSIYRKGEEDGKPIAAKDLEVEKLKNNEERATLLLVPDAELWDVERPVLYTLRTELIQAGKSISEGPTLDRVDVTFGFRLAQFHADGFYLNGRKLLLRGLNRHQSWPYIGYAAPKSLQRMDAELLKHELGLNAVRTSHYPQSPHFIDRCDELGLLVFTEIPGWQYIGDDAWQEQAVRNTEEMVQQYRNHPSIILWGVRINESRDNDALYQRTNAAAHRLDPTRPTGGVRCYKKSSLLEDVYTYNDFFHDGTNAGCEPKKAVTSDPSKAYLISEYNGHMYPTKPFDSEEHRLEHAMRHARVLDAVAGEKDIAGSFGWCMFDYNTHKDFGSGDRICYHGVMDMFRNKKLAADVYSVYQDETPVLNVSSSMDIGEHPAGNRGRIFLFTNADEVRMYQNDQFIRSYTKKDSPFKHLRRPPMEITDYIGERIREGEHFTPTQAKLVKDMLNHSARFGSGKLPPSVMAKAAVAMAKYGMKPDDAYQLYGKYVGNWGAAATVYRFEAVKDGKVVAAIERGPAEGMRLRAEASQTVLHENDTYDAALVRLRMEDLRGSTLAFYVGAVTLKAEGPIEIVGPETTVLRGGMGGTIVRTTGEKGEAKLTITAEGAEPVVLEFQIEKE